MILYIFIHFRKIGTYIEIDDNIFHLIFSVFLFKVNVDVGQWCLSLSLFISLYLSLSLSSAYDYDFSTCTHNVRTMYVICNSSEFMGEVILNRLDVVVRSSYNYSRMRLIIIFSVSLQCLTYNNYSIPNICTENRRYLRNLSK